MKPEFIDNRGKNTLLNALQAHLEWLEQTCADPIMLSIATGYFNPEGFSLLADHLRRLKQVRLLLGAEPTPPPARPIRKPGQPRGEKYDAVLVDRALQMLEEGLIRDRNLLGFTPEVDENVRRLIEFLESGSLEVRRYEKAFLHGKAFIFSHEEGVIAGSSNFTAAGLTTNLELNLGRYDPTPVVQVKNWFDELWDEAEPFNLADVYDARYFEYSPYLIYLRVLWELYGAELEGEKEPDSPIQLTTFQNDGIFRARRILEKYHGVVIADGVGLGKTFIGGQLIHEAVHDRRQRALLIAPAALRDGTWARFNDTHQLYVETISYEELATDAQLGGDRPKLKQNKDDYALIVIDEAQAFRTPGTNRAFALRRLLQGTPPKDLVLLSATPVNNTLWDLYYLLNYFVKHDAVFADRGVISLRERFKEAVDEDPYELRPDILFDILDATTVRRTRHFVKEYYRHDKVPGPNGQKIPIRFPEPHVEKVDYDLEDVLPAFFEQFAETLAPEEGEPELTLARYHPSHYKRRGEVEHNEVALVGLLRSALLKRFESSAYAFCRTVQRMAEQHKAFLEALDKGYIATAGVLEEWSETDSDEEYESLLEESGSVSAEDYDIETLKRDVLKDLDILLRFGEVAEAVQPENDPKLLALLDELADIAAKATREGFDEEDFRDKRKVIIFSYYADTVDWIERFILNEVQKNERLKPYQGRIASVTSEASRRGISRARAIFGFAPRSSEAPEPLADDLYDVLITTDVLAEGQNLQECRNIINYDLPWNPMRLVQRNGRIDRIGSRHEDIYIRCFFPDKQLDALLELEDRIRRKLAQAAAAVGLESEVIPDGATNEVVFADTVEQIRKLQREDAELLATGGEEPNAYSGEEYRQELRQGLIERRDEITLLPWAAGSGFSLGLQRGHFFCARVGERVFLRFVPSADEKNIIKDTLGCLRQITCTRDTPRYMHDEMKQAAYNAWAIARKDIHNEWTYETDPANLQPYVRPLFREIADHLRSHPPKDVLQGELTRVIESIEAPWGLRIERQFREIFLREGLTPIERSEMIIDMVDELGMEPFVPPPVLPIIDEDEIQLVCWMAVDSDI